MPLLKPTEAARELGRAPQTLARWRSEGVGPAFYRINGRIYYDSEDIKAERERNRFTSTSEAQAAQAAREQATEAA